MIEKKPVLVSGLPLSAEARGVIDDYEKQPEAWKLGVLRDNLEENDPGSPLLTLIDRPHFHAMDLVRKWKCGLLESIDKQQCYDWRTAISPVLFDQTEDVGLNGVVTYYGPVLDDDCLDDHGKGYAEPGYSTPLGFILFDNWNDYDGDRFPAWIIDPNGVEFDPEEMLDVEQVLEALGCEMEWSDEWATCSDCGRAVRTHPDCWHWQPHYEWVHDEIVCLDCYRQNTIEEELEA